MQNIKNKIISKLQQTQEDHNVKIALAIESGSRAWGFASEDSDYDCRFIYANPKDWYVSIFDKKDTIIYDADKIFDINGWDIKKVLKHISKSNAVMFEWLSSNQIYMKNDEVKIILDDLAADFFNPIAVSYHYLSIAKNKLNEILKDEKYEKYEINKAKLKKYFYVMRPIANLNFIYDFNKMPPIEYDKTLSHIKLDDKIYEQIQILKNIKIKTDESFEIPKNDILIDYFNNQINEFNIKLKNIKYNKQISYKNIDIAFIKILELM